MRAVSPQRWRILSPYLDEALDLDPDARVAWLANLAHRDASLAGDLRAILAEHEVVHQAGFMDVPVIDPQMALTGQEVGAYRLLSLIGQGGSGSVWLAERADGRFQGRAAVKLLNLALVKRSGEERFRREGTILAHLRHPNIAHLIDAGVTSAGQPYMVLEYVDGQTVDKYCADHRLSVQARIRLFLDVLEAVAHAHTNLVVHRDIKPANVLVSTDGQVKLLDFGIAKLLEPNAEWQPQRTPESSAITREVGRALTPEFAAPEQLAGGALTTATDVYALGVLLYILLTGRHPAGNAVESRETLVKAIVSTEPTPISKAVTAVDQAPDGAAAHAAHCRTTPARLRNVLRGDLEAIVAKALRKDPAERYVSVTAFAGDLQRYLRHDPVSARVDTLAYRTSRFIRRHAAGVAISTAAVLLIGAAIIVHTTRLSIARDRAERETAKAVKVSEVLMGLLTSADPYTVRTAPGDVTVRALLDAGADQVQRDLAGQPEVQAELLTMMGRTYRHLAAFDKAQLLLERALDSGIKAFGPEHVRVAQTLDYLGVVMTDRGDYAAAVQTLERALAMRRKLLGSAHEDVGITLVELGRVYQDQGSFDRAEVLDREALEIRRAALGEGHRETAVSQSDLAAVLRWRGDLATAESLLQQSLETNRSTRGDDHPNTAAALHDLALIASAKGDNSGAESVLRHVLSIQQRKLGEHHPIVATTLNSLSRVLVRQGRFIEAATPMQQALDLARAAHGDSHQLVAIYTLNLASIELGRQQAPVAERLAIDGIRLRSRAPAIVPTRRRTVREDDWSVGGAKSLLGAALTAQRRYDEAEAVLIDARRDLESTTSRSSDLKTTIGRLVDLYVAWGKPEKAATYRALLD
jgi:serine/threonine protein kinase/tetratricopeptide (TPR) repeat protein